MFKDANKKIATVAAAVGLIMGSTVASAEDPMRAYAQDAEKSVVTNAYGECWQSKGGVKQLVEKCGDVIAKEEPAPTPVPVDGDDDNDGVPNSRDKCPNTRAGATVDADGCEITENLTINLVVEEFDFDSAVLKPEMKAALEDFADKVKASPGHESVTVIGHTDSTGPEAYNLKLSERRAQAAADYLESLGIDSITVKGMGESQPIADNSTREGRAQNRRIEITTH
ncbi:OmpA family protein [Thiolapillus sp.]|uniref:OmpA family protein n=1 Tax=Thiolapillus sp. TaxID=2017437 RepID=UPI0025FF13B2|nr:OmpA family protein [Thiolapillus sp.]